MDRDVGALRELLGVILTAYGSLLSLLALSQLIGSVLSYVRSRFDAQLISQLAFGAWAITDSPLCCQWLRENIGRSLGV